MSKEIRVHGCGCRYTVYHLLSEKIDEDYDQICDHLCDLHKDQFILKLFNSEKNI